MNITVHPKDRLGRADFGWLQARYHFSFGDYHDPERMGLGALRVVNDDLVKAGTGFDTHPHRDMEIITYVRKGAITHKDSRGNHGRTAAGQVQVMSAGTGIYHSEFNLESEDTSLYQIWIIPREKGVTPRWEAAAFPTMMTGGENGQKAAAALPLLVSGRKADEGKGALFIHQDAAIYGGRMAAGTRLRQPVGALAYLLVSAGEIAVEGHLAAAGDGVSVRSAADSVSDSGIVELCAVSDAEVLVITIPERPLLK